MPYTRLISAVLLATLIGVAIAGPYKHPWFTQEALWLAVLLSLVVYGMSLMRDFFLDVIVIFFSAYFVQRILVIYFWPDTLDYQPNLDFVPETFTTVILFMVACAVAVWLGYGLARLTDGRTWMRGGIALDPIRILGTNVPFERLFHSYAMFAIPLLLLELGLLATTGVGTAGYEFDRSLAVIYRISFVASSIGFLAIVALLKGGLRPGVRRLAIWLIVLQLALALGRTSKASLLSLILTIIVCYYFTRGHIPRWLVWIGGGVLMFTIFFFAPAIVAVRVAVLASIRSSGSWVDILQVLNRLALPPFDQLLLNFSNRLGGFDWLAGLMTVGREAFPHWVSPGGDLVQILNSFVPGDLIEVRDWVPVEALIPIMLRGYPSVKSLTGHRELMGIAGMTYLYFGLLLGPMFFSLWSFVSTKIIRSELNIVFKILYFKMFVIVLFIGGAFTTPVLHFYEGIIALMVSYVLYQWIYKVGPICVGKRPKMIDGGQVA